MLLSSTNCLSMKSSEAPQLSKESMLMELWVLRVLRPILTRTEFPLFEERDFQANWKSECSGRIEGNSSSSEESKCLRGQRFLSTCLLGRDNILDEVDGVLCNVTLESSEL